MMEITDAQFVISAVNNKGCPKPEFPEYAFIGRSNVGKSSLINMLTNRRNLAKTSSRPGKTQTINYFIIDKSWYLVDLPGLGYAKTSKTIRFGWEKMISDYLIKRPNLLCTFMLIDSRLEPQKIDLEFMEWLGVNQIPFVIAFTKTDKLSKNQLQKNIEHYKTSLLKTWEELPQSFITSSTEKRGKEEIISFINLTNQVFTNTNS